MQVIQSRESVGNLVKLSYTSVQLSPSILTIGGQQYQTNYLTCDLSISSVGGLDTGSLLANKVYYIYAVFSLGSVALIASISPVNPLGNLVNKKVAALITDESGNIGKTVNLSGDLSFTITKALPTSPTSGGDLPSLSFLDLEVGEEYEVSGQLTAYSYGDSTAGMYFHSEANGLGTRYARSSVYGLDGNTIAVTAGISFKFTALTGGLYVSVSSSAANFQVQGDGTTGSTYVQLTRNVKLDWKQYK